jgi:hypothetical protein
VPFFFLVCFDAPPPSQQLNATLSRDSGKRMSVLGDPSEKAFPFALLPKRATQLLAT